MFILVPVRWLVALLVHGVRLEVQLPIARGVCLNIALQGVPLAYDQYLRIAGTARGRVAWMWMQRSSACKGVASTQNGTRVHSTTCESQIAPRIHEQHGRLETIRRELSRPCCDDRPALLDESRAGSCPS